MSTENLAQLTPKHPELYRLLQRMPRFCGNGALDRALDWFTSEGYRPTKGARNVIRRHVEGDADPKRQHSPKTYFEHWRRQKGQQSKDFKSWTIQDFVVALHRNVGNENQQRFLRRRLQERIKDAEIRELQNLPNDLQDLQTEKLIANRLQTLALEANPTAEFAFENENPSIWDRVQRNLTARKPLGPIAAALFGCQQASSRAKQTWGYSDCAYNDKESFMQALCEELSKTGRELNWGWGTDETSEVSNVLYIQLPTGQVSFHSTRRFQGPDFTGKWDGLNASEARVITFCQQVLDSDRNGREIAS